MKCPTCKGSTRVLEVRTNLATGHRRRRRWCGECGHRFSTWAKKGSSRESLKPPK